MKAMSAGDRQRFGRATAHHPYRRDEIVRVAIELFHRHGVSQTNVEAIAEQAGIRPATLYHHFRDKQAIVDAAVDLAHARLASRLKQRERASTDAGRRLEALVDALVDHVLEDLPMAAVGRHDRVHAGNAVRRRAEKVDESLVESIASALAAARPSLPDAKRRALAHGLIGAVWSVTHSDLRLDTAGLREYLRRAGRTLVFGRRARRISAE